MSYESKGINPEKDRLEIDKQLSRLWRAVEGNAADDADWLANARMNAYTSLNTGAINIDSTPRAVINSTFKTGGGVLFGFAMVTGNATEARIKIYAEYDGAIIEPAAEFDADGCFTKTLIFAVRVKSGLQELKLYAVTALGTAEIPENSARIIFFVPGSKF